MRALIAATQSEARLDADTWNEFFEVVLAARGANLAAKVRAWSWSTVPRGTRAKYTLPLVRVTGRHDFTEALMNQVSASGGRALTDRVASSIVDDLIDPARWTIGRQRASLLGLHLTRYIAWATFDSRGRAYANLRHLRADAIACDLGFDDPAEPDGVWMRRIPLLVAEYAPNGQSVRIPTMVEAWGAEPPNYYFTPALAGERWGETKPWRTPPKGHIPQARPEVVHTPVSVAELRSPVLEVGP